MVRLNIGAYNVPSNPPARVSDMLTYLSTSDALRIALCSFSLNRILEREQEPSST